MFFRYTDDTKTSIESATVLHTPHGTFDGTEAPDGWVFANSIEEFVGNPTNTITMRQLRLWLLQNSLLQSVEDLIVALPEPTKSQALIEWNYAHVVEPTNPFVIQFAQALNITDIPAMFSQARAL